MDLGVYVQVPFCQTKCTYCNFHTGVVSNDRYQPYADAVCREIQASALAASAVDTVYFGGGTPSLLDPESLRKILVTLREKCCMDFREVTLEADPETITSAKASGWLAAGFNRISLGVQSFSDRELQATGRLHRRTDIYQAVRCLRDAGFGNISMDLIAGLPHQTHESWKSSLGDLLGVHPEHVSIYMLEIDEESRLGKESLSGGGRYGASAIPSDDLMAEFYELACVQLRTEGYEHYEISNWGLPGRRSQHNLKYWRREPYAGFGAGSHSFDGCRRWANVHDAARYLECIEKGVSPCEKSEVVSSEQALEEEFFLGLRQLDGVDLARIEHDYAVHSDRLASLRGRINRLNSQGLVDLEGMRLRLVPDRLTISNEVFVELLG